MVSGGFFMKDTIFLLSLISQFSRTRTKHLARVLCHWAVATPEIVLGGKTGQNPGSLPPKLRVLSAVFFHGLEPVFPSDSGSYASGPQNASGMNRPEHCVCFSVLPKRRLRREETAAASSDSFRILSGAGCSSRKTGRRAWNRRARPWPKSCKRLERARKQSGACLHLEIRYLPFSGPRTASIPKASARGNNARFPLREVFRADLLRGRRKSRALSVTKVHRGR